MKGQAHHWSSATSSLEKGIYSLDYCREREEVGRMVEAARRENLPVDRIVRIARAGYHAAWRAEIKRSVGRG